MATSGGIVGCPSHRVDQGSELGAAERGVALEAHFADRRARPLDDLDDATDRDHLGDIVAGWRAVLHEHRCDLYTAIPLLRVPLEHRVDTGLERPP